ncbi:MAG: hypothetical protein CVV42_07240 [Candidatus Riflebacteria bacterium HGW-Riflebacteria-2]|jgi:hypothetical protein|nr:MAG: hypothetical protein CVV42_07240 [Candidatus Riflebacteria bacterium HGW-Riflebacteria-2]
MSSQPKDFTPVSTRLTVLSVVLLLAMALSAQHLIKSRYWNYYYPEVQVTNFGDIVLQTIPAQIKSFLAGIFRITADEYMHIGPTKKAKQNFVAGSFAGNTEIMSLLEISIILEPTNMEMYAVMSHNLALYLNRFKDAIKLLHRGIQANKESPDLHKLYGAAAYCYGFIKKPSFASPAEVKRNREIAVNYLDAAIEAYLANEHRITPYMHDDFANLQNYYVMKTRFLSDIGKKKEAIAAWQKVAYERQQESYLGYYITMLQQEEAGLPDFPDDLLAPEYQALFQVSTIKPPYGSTAAYRSWLVDPASLFYLTLYARGLGAPSLLMQDNHQHATLPSENKPFSELDEYGHNNTHAHQHDHPGHDHADEVCPQGHHHEHGHECPHCASAKSWKQAGTSVMLQALAMLAAAIIIRRFV